MPVVLIQKDLFTEAENIAVEEDLLYGTNYNVRRPLWGMTVKSARYAYISLYQDLGQGPDGVQTVSIIDESAPGGYSGANHNFILQAVAEQRQEKVQIVETFGDHFAFFYGQKPIILNVRGMLLNSGDFNWKNEFIANYDRFLRGTRCVENKTRVFLGWDDVLAQGYILNVGINYTQEMPLVIPFTFSMLLTKPPLDLSNAAAPLDNPNPNLRQPWTYRSLESDPNGDGWLPEYVPNDNGEYGTGTRPSQLVTIGVDGKAVVQSGANGQTAGSAESPNNTAYWISGTDRLKKQWNDEEEALLRLNTLLTSAQTGKDSVSTALALRSNPEEFQLANRNDATLEVFASLSSGVANSSAVVDDAPDVE
jgi:hypothetical protein